jgi:hypothetical protein
MGTIAWTCSFVVIANVNSEGHVVYWSLDTDAPRGRPSARPLNARLARVAAGVCARPSSGDLRAVPRQRKEWRQ